MENESKSESFHSTDLTAKELILFEKAPHKSQKSKVDKPKVSEEELEFERIMNEDLSSDEETL